MFFTHHKIYFNITGAFPFICYPGSLFYRHSVKNNTTGILPGSTFPSSSAMAKFIIKLIARSVGSFSSMLTGPYPLIKPLMAKRTASWVMPLFTDQFRVPFFNLEPTYCLLLHGFGKLDQVGLFMVALDGSALCIISQIATRCTTSLSRIWVL